MLKQKSAATRPGRASIGALVLLALLASSALRASAQNPDDFQSERARAIQLINERKFADALPALERLAASSQADGQVMYGLGIALLMTADGVKDAEAQRKARLRGRESLVRAQQMGVSDANLAMLIKSVKPDGNLAGVSANKEANEAMRVASEAFSAKDYEKAAREYERAARLDPALYEAALYAGNTHYSLKSWDKAGEWFARAIAIDPEKETAHRYWADALMYAGKQEEARDRFFEAVIADPYSQLTWRGLSNWAERNKVTLAHPKIEIPTSVSSPSGGNVSITIDEKALKEDNADGSAAWMMYGLSRAVWPTGKDGKLSERFAKAYPNEKTYRHSLAEEADALRMVVTMLKEGKKVKQLEPSLARLVKLEEAGLIEPYVLFARADRGIAQDFAEYRKANREKLRRYLLEYVIKGGGN
ncbi:MAG TPA: tetratricopeptide repeat protein [Pyrinomonadaceae bacterium]|nr:tetratricopeptide repeat protein [Pyrinomonadaceae bacterium]